jgi:hypothetical protein
MERGIDMLVGICHFEKSGWVIMITGVSIGKEVLFKGGWENINRKQLHMSSIGKGLHKHGERFDFEKKHHCI